MPKTITEVYHGVGADRRLLYTIEDGNYRWNNFINAEEEKAPVSPKGGRVKRERVGKAKEG